VNLANTSGSEGTLGKSFKQEAERFAKIKTGFEVVNFDFHHECKGMRYDRQGPATAHLRFKTLWNIMLCCLSSMPAFLQNFWYSGQC